MLHFASRGRRSASFKTVATASSSSQAESPIIVAKPVPALLADDLHALPGQCLENLNQLPSDSSKELLTATLITVFDKLSTYYVRARAELSRERRPDVLTKFFALQGHTMMQTPAALEEWGNTYDRVGKSYRGLNLVLAAEGAEGELPALDYIYVELMKMHNDSKGFINAVLSNEIPDIMPVFLKTSFILAELKIIEKTKEILRAYLSLETQLLIEKSKVVMDASGTIYFAVQVDKLGEYFQAKLQSITPTLAELDNITRLDLIDEMNELNAHAQLYEASVNVFSNLLFKPGEPLGTLYHQMAMLLPLCELINSIPEKVQSIKHKLSVEPELSITELEEALAQCDITPSSSSSSTQDCQIKLGKPPRVVTPHFNGRKKAQAVPTVMTPPSSTAAHLSWGDRLSGQADTIYEIFSTKNVYPKDLLNLMQALGGTIKPQKKGVGFVLPAAVQASFPCSSSSTFTTNFHTPHAKRREGPLSPSLVDRFKHLLTTCQLTPDLLWPASKPKARK